MSNDLISRSTLMSHIESERRQWGEDYDAEQILGDIEYFPTAYDMDKVVRQLEAYSNADEAERLGTMPVVELVDAITIVKGGGADAKTDS